MAVISHARNRLQDSIAAIDPRWYGAEGDGVANDYTALDTALGLLEIQGGGTLELSDGTYAFTGSDLVIPENVTVHGAGGVLVPDTGYDVDVEGTVDAVRQIFDTTSGGVTFANAAHQDIIRPEWWGGAAGVAAATNDAAFAASIDAAEECGAEIRLFAGDYDYSTQIDLPLYVRIRGVGEARDTGLCTTLTYSGSGYAISIDSDPGGAGTQRRFNSVVGLRLIGNTAAALLHVRGGYQNFFEHLLLKGDSTNTAKGIYIQGDDNSRGVYYNVFRDINIEGCANAVYLDGDDSETGTARGNVNLFDNVRATTYGGIGWYCKGLETNTFINCKGESSIGDTGLQILGDCVRMAFFSCYYEYNTADFDSRFCGLAGVPLMIGCRYSTIADGSRHFRLGRRVRYYDHLASTGWMEGHVTFIGPVTGQDESDYDNSPTTEGTFTAGSGYSVSDVITMSDGTEVTVNTIGGSGDVLTFDVYSALSGGVEVSDTLTQASVAPSGGSGFELILDTDNVTTPEANERFNMRVGGRMNWGPGDTVTDTYAQRLPADDPGLEVGPGVRDQTQGLASSSGDLSIDCGDGYNVRCTLSEDTDVLTPTRPENGAILKISFRQDGGNSYTVSFASVFEMKDDDFQVPYAHFGSNEYADISFRFNGGFSKWTEVGRSATVGRDKPHMRGVYDFSVQGGTQGTINLGALPTGSIITQAWYCVTAAFTSGGSALVSFGVSTVDATGLKAAVAYGDASYGTGSHDFTPDGTATNFTTVTSGQQNVIMTISGADLTAGRVQVFCDYIIAE